MNSNLDKNFKQTAATLAEALPYIQRYEGSTIVIKLGGHAMTSKSLMDNFARERKASIERTKISIEHVKKLEETIDMLMKQKAYLQRQLRKKKLNEEKNDK